MRETKSTCPYCGVGCGVIIESDADRITGVRGDPDHPANLGRLCTKGSTLHLTATQAVIDTSRLLQPKLRDSRDAPWRGVSWDSAITTVADRFAAVIAEHGADAVGFYISGQLLTEDYYVFNKLAKGLVGTNNIDTNSRLCMSSAVAGYKQALGADAPPACYDDLNHAHCLFIAGSNMAWAHPVLFRRLEDARAANPAMRIVVVDPRRTETAEFADLHLAIQPGTDVALFHGMLHAMIWEDLIDRDFIAAHTEGFEALKALVRDTPPRAAAQRCGIDEQALMQAARWFAQAPATLSLYCQGLNQSTSGTAKNTALINLHLATRQIGRAGAGPFSLTGQPNAMGGREVGGMANLLSAHRDLSNAEHRAEVARLWGIDDVPATPGKTAVEMFEAAASGEIKALWIACTNPAQSMPDQHLVRAALERCPFVVVQEAFDRTATAEYAHVLLPASTWGEKDGTVTNSERRISRVRAAVAAPGEARADWVIARDVGRALQSRLALTQDDAQPRARTLPHDLLAYDDAESIWLEHRESTRGRDLDITGLSWAMLDAQGPQQWPLPEGAASGAARLYEHLDADGRFATPNGRARFIAKPYAPPADERSPAYPIALTTTRLRDQWHGMSRTGTAPKLFAHDEAPALRMHPADFARRGLAEGKLVRVASRRGAIVVPLRADDRVGRGQADLAMHWGSEFLGGRDVRGPHARIRSLPPEGASAASGRPGAAEGPHARMRSLPPEGASAASERPGAAEGRQAAGVNALTTSRSCPDSRQPELKHAAVSVKTAELPWRFAAARWFDQPRDALALQPQLRAAMRAFEYALCVPVAGPDGIAGLRFEAASAQPIAGAALNTLIDTLGLAVHAAARYDDARRHRARRLWIDGEGDAARLSALCLAGPQGEGSWLFDLWRSRAAVAPFGRALLSPDAAMPAGVAPHDEQVCNCFDVSKGRIVRALQTIGAENGVDRLKILQTQLACGTQCGSCLPSLRRLVHETPCAEAAATLA